MSYNKLYIVGNGFDIYHGIPSRYSDFKNYLKFHDHLLLENVEKYLPVEDNWCNLELAFAYIDVDYLIEEALQFLQSYSAEEWSDSFHHDYQYELDKVVSDLSSNLKSYFCQWINQLELPAPESLINKVVGVNKSAIFLSFNYTQTLQHVYNVNDDNILHIHGKVGQDESEIVLGHSWNPEIIPDLNDIPNPEDMDTRIMEGNDIINSYFGKTFKPSAKIIESNIDFFSNLKGVTKIFVLGHSLSEVDLPYFEEIIKNVDINSEWLITYYGDEELESHKNTIDELGVKNAIFCNLSEVA